MNEMKSFKFNVTIRNKDREDIPCSINFSVFFLVIGLDLQLKLMTMFESV